MDLSGAGVCARRPRLPRSRPRSTLRRWCRARPGSGWFGVVRHRSRPRAHVSFAQNPLGAPFEVTGRDAIASGGLARLSYLSKC
jgi:hypothetical protein